MNILTPVGALILTLHWKLNQKNNSFNIKSTKPLIHTSLHNNAAHEVHINVIFVTLRVECMKKSVALYCATHVQDRKFYLQVIPSNLFLPRTHMNP
jgi:hypothetical protein